MTNAVSFNSRKVICLINSLSMLNEPQYTNVINFISAFN